MDKFEIGEIVDFIGIPGADEQLNGRAGPGAGCEIKQYCWDFKDGPGYYCHFPGDLCPHSVEGWWWVSKFHLRKKKPPQELGSWEEVQKLTNWNPTGVEA